MNATAMASITGGDTGVSSQAIWCQMMGVPNTSPFAKFGTAPSDPDDFGRCYRLLNLMPEWRARIGEMASHGPEWSALAAAWDELTALYEAEVDRTGPYHRGTAMRLYERMRELRTPPARDREGR